MFQRPQKRRTTLTVSRETAARVGKLAMICALETGEMGVLASLVGVLTLPNIRAYRAGLVEEIDAFERRVYRRTQLLLGETRFSRSDLSRRTR